MPEYYEAKTLKIWDYKSREPWLTEDRRQTERTKGWRMKWQNQKKEGNKGGKKERRKEMDIKGPMHINIPK